MGRIWKVLTRKKTVDPVTAEETRLSRVLNVFDLTALGVGSTLGVGVYVLAGQVARYPAGPSVVLSFLIAAIASVFAGLCYAEFGARAPKAGSAYIYSYVCVGEFIAFVIGWNLILEYVIGSASVARSLSLYLDTLINNTLQDTFKEIAPLHVSFLASYFDFFSFGISILLAIFLAFGVKESSMANNILTCLNVAVVLFVIIAGSLKANPENWHISPNSTHNITNGTDIGNGGFFPWGVDGMIKGAATCFYGFVGFDCIATTAEEVKNPRKAIPLSIIVSLFIIFLAYFGVATVLTLMVPYYLQDSNAPIPAAFAAQGWYVAKWIVAIGSIFGLCVSLFGAMFPLPRIIYAMGSDGLVFKCLAKVHPKFQTPVIGTILAGLLTGLMSALFDLSQLVNMMSIGTLLAYTIVAASVLLLRYQEEVKKVYIPIKMSSDTESVSSESSVDEKYNDETIRQNFDGPTTNDEQELITSESSSFSRSLKYIINCRVKEPNRTTENVVVVEVLLYCILCVGIGLCAIYLKTNLANGETWAIIVTSVVVGLTILVLISLVTQPQSKKELSFKVPFVPIIPALSILVNVYLMLMLDYMTWVRFAVWMVVGLPMYYICACTQKPPPKPQNRRHYAANLTNGHSKISNGIPNLSFVCAEANGQTRKLKHNKKKAAPPPPTIYELPENIEVQQEAAIAQLDEILDKEDAIEQLENVTFNNRKLSVGASSNVSAVASHSEDVVAVVHCADVVTPVADPKIARPFPSSHHTYYLDSKPPSSTKQNTVVEKSSFEEENLLKLDKEHKLLVSEAPELLEARTDTSNTENTEEKGDLSPINNFHDIPRSAAEAEPSNTEITKKLTHIHATSPQDNANSIDEELPSINSPPAPLAIEYAKVSNSEYASSSVLNEEAIKTVTLRHVKKKIKEVECGENQNACDDNLRVGSQEYKNFVKDLDSKLKRLTVIPSFYVPPRKDIVTQQKQVLPNENVIEESIDRADAKEKLKSFYASKKKLVEAENESSFAENPPRLLYGSKSVDESLLKVNQTPKGIDEDNRLHLLNENNEDYLLKDHKIKMANVFNTIKLKKFQDEEHVNRRLSKTVGSSFAKIDDKSDHKQKMEDIFKSIKAIRKESFKKEKEVEKTE